jgi:hypothetical protein
VPDAPKGSEKKQESRRAVIIKALKSEVLEMPECDAAHIVAYLFEIGPTLAGGMGEVPVPESEIESWQRNTGIELQSWEARTVKRLSREYLSESQAATEPNRACPWPDAPYAGLYMSIRMQSAIAEMAS